MTANSTSKQIRNFLLLIGGGVAFAVVVIGLMIYSYRGERHPRSKQVLLSPETAVALQAASKPNIMFEGVELWVLSAGQKEWKALPISLQQYQSMFSHIADDKSITTVNPLISKAFDDGRGARLLLKVRPVGRPASAGYVLQEVHFSSDDLHYRIEQSEATATRQWLYFRHPGALTEIVRSAGLTT